MYSNIFSIQGPDDDKNILKHSTQTRLHRAVSFALLICNIRLLIISWKLYSILGRLFVMLPFSIEMVLSTVLILMCMYYLI